MQETKLFCGLCGKSGKLTKTSCCGELICDDVDQYVLFSYATNSCYSRYTLCSFYNHEEHKGIWKDCEKCKKAFNTEIYVWHGTNEYNFEKLENPPDFEPTKCAKCKKIINLGEDGYGMSGKDYFCLNCMDADL